MKVINIKVFINILSSSYYILIHRNSELIKHSTIKFQLKSFQLHQILIYWSKIYFVKLIFKKYWFYHLNSFNIWHILNIKLNLKYEVNNKVLFEVRCYKDDKILISIYTLTNILCTWRVIICTLQPNLGLKTL